MAKEKKQGWIYNPWIITFVAYLLLSPLGSRIYDSTKTIPIITPILSVWHFIWNIFTYKIALWIVILIYLIGYALNQLLKTINTDVPLRKPERLPLLDYTSDRFKQWKWSWEYKLYDRKFAIENLTPVCDKCEIKTLESGMSFSAGYYRCPMCGQEYISQYSGEYSGDIQALINDRITKRGLNMPTTDY